MVAQFAPVLFYCCMLLTRTLACAGLLIMLIVSGCTRRPQVPQSQQPLPPTAADPQEVQRIREWYFRAYTESAVGVVIATEPSGAPFVAVGQIPDMSMLRVNQRVDFLDGSGRILAPGRIVKIFPDNIHVQYDTPPRGGREPRRGDVMVYVPGPARTL